MSGVFKRFIDADDVWDVLGKNYIKNPGASQDTTHWYLYQDTAQSTPVDGDGGTSDLVLTRITSAGVLRSSGSFKLEKPAQDTQGQGVGTLFTIDPADKNKELPIQFDYYTDGTYQNDLRVFIYDVDNGQILNVRNDQNGVILGSSAPTSFVGTFSATGSSNYKLLFHCQTTNALAFGLYYDAVSVYRSSVFIGDSVIVEYATNTSGITAAGASDTANWINGGPGSLAEKGAPIGAINSNTAGTLTSFVVQFSDDLRPGDRLDLEVQHGAGQWVSPPILDILDIIIISYLNNNTYYYGVGLDGASNFPNRALVRFGNGGRVLGTTYASNGINGWSSVSTWRWRVKRTRVIKNTYSTTELLNKSTNITFSASQESVPDNTVVDVDSVTVSKDELNEMSATGIFTPGESGKYKLNIPAKWSPSGNGGRIVILRNVTDSVDAAVVSMAANTGSGLGTEYNIPFELDLEAGKQYRLQSYQTSGGPLDFSVVNASITRHFEPTVYGVYGKRETKSFIDTSTRAVSNPTLGDWGLIPGWTMTLPSTGVYDLSIASLMQAHVNASIGHGEIAFSTSPTPGSERIKAYSTGYHGTSADLNSTKGFQFRYEGFVATGPTTIYIHARLLNVSSAGSVTALQLRNDVITGGGIMQYTKVK